MPFISAPYALLLGFITAQTIGNPFATAIKTYKISSRLLQYSIVGLGAGMTVQSAVTAGRQGILLTLVTIVVTLVLGMLLGYLAKINKKISCLIASGTAICGGSAIAAVAPVIRADDRQLSVALGIVFILNSVALFVFPAAGHYLDMSQYQFGLWSAIAIHDTSSVTGAAASYGAEALETATTVKLARALWIIPLTVFAAFLFRKEKGQQKITIPFFILFFMLAIGINTYVPGMSHISPSVSYMAKRGLVLTLFLIGAGLPLHAIKAVGWRPLLLGISLWIIIAIGSLIFILNTIP